MPSTGGLSDQTFNREVENLTHLITPPPVVQMGNVRPKGDDLFISLSSVPSRVPSEKPDLREP